MKQEKVIKTFKDFLLKMFTAESGLSSKRVCGFLGWIVCLFICIYCTIMVIQAPLILETLFICSTALLGLDSVTRIWKKNDKYNKINNESISNDEKE